MRRKHQDFDMMHIQMSTQKAHQSLQLINEYYSIIAISLPIIVENTKVQIVYLRQYLSLRIRVISDHFIL